jgi:hypothetical protein
MGILITSRGIRKNEIHNYSKRQTNRASKRTTNFVEKNKNIPPLACQCLETG